MCVQRGIVQRELGHRHSLAVGGVGGGYDKIAAEKTSVN